MILRALFAIGAILLVPASAFADSVPFLDVTQVCDGIARQGGVTFHDPAIAKEKKNCIDSEQEIRGELAKQWGKFNASDKVHCTNEARMGGESSYTELLTCLEMARDVRALKVGPLDALGLPEPPAPRRRRH